MRIFMKKTVLIVVVISLFLTACGVEGPSDINWNETENTSDFTDVNEIPEFENLLGEDQPLPQNQFEYLVPEEREEFNFNKWCETDLGYTDEVNCAGDEHNGWWQFKQNGNITEIQVRSQGSSYVIKNIDGIYYLYCPGGIKVIVDDDFVENIKLKTVALENAYEEFDKAKTDLIASIVGTLTAAVTGCIVGFAYLSVVGSVTIPVFGTIAGGVAGCIAGATVGGVSTLFGFAEKIYSGVYKWWSANKEIKDAKKQLESQMTANCG